MKCPICHVEMVSDDRMYRCPVCLLEAATVEQMKEIMRALKEESDAAD